VDTLNKVTLGVIHGWHMDMRELKALELAARARIIWEDGAWSVPSQSGNGKYRVDLHGPSCTCEDFQLRQLPLVSYLRCTAG
jgi:hypothetical protein